MSTKAEIKRQKELKKKISLVLRVVCVAGLIVLGVVYCMGPDGSHDDQQNAKGYSVEDASSEATGEPGQKTVDNSRTNPESKSEGKKGSSRSSDIDNNSPDVYKTSPVEVPHYDSDGRLNINVATEAELCKLNGIGEKRARDIIDYRNTFGEFKTIEDIMKVKGIKQGVFSKIKEDITCEVS